MSSGLRLVMRLPSTTTSSSHPLAAGVAEVGLQAGPARQPPALRHVGLDEGPGGVADGGDGLAGVDEVADERDGLLVHAEGVGVGDAAGQHQRVVVVDGDVGHPAVDPLGAGLVEVLEQLHLALVGGEQLGGVAGVDGGLPGLGELRPPRRLRLRWQECDALGHVIHRRSSLRGRTTHQGVEGCPMMLPLLSFASERADDHAAGSGWCPRRSA